MNRTRLVTGLMVAGVLAMLNAWAVYAYRDASGIHGHTVTRIQNGGVIR